MLSKARSPEEYIETLPEDRQAVMAALRDAINRNLPRGFEEVMDGMLGWVVPYELYPPGYHCPPKQPLPFIGLASQKNHIAVYHMSIYCDPILLAWFQAEWPKHSSKRLDMGKSCIKFSRAANVPVDLIGELAAKVTPAEWIDIYELEMKPKK